MYLCYKDETIWTIVLVLILLFVLITEIILILILLLNNYFESRSIFLIDNSNYTQYYNKNFIMDRGLIYMENSLLNIEKENETIAHRFYMEIFQRGKLEVIDEIVSPNFVMHNPMLPSEVKEGPEGVRKFSMATIDAIPDR